MGFWHGVFAGILILSVIHLVTTTTPERALQNLKAWMGMFRGDVAQIDESAD
jgi:hypothetical protein